MQLRYRKGWSHHQPVLPDTYTSDSRSLHQRFQRSRLNKAETAWEQFKGKLPSSFPVVIFFMVLPLKDTAAIRTIAHQTLKTYQSL